jgi:hypothetical protein
MSPKITTNLQHSAAKKNKFSVHQMEREVTYSTKPLEDAVSKRLKNSEGETVNWLNIQWMRFLKNAPYKMFYKTSMEPNAKFCILDLSPK